MNKSQADPISILVKKTKRPRGEVLEACAERAAIRQYEGGLSRAEAERLALEDALDLLGDPS